METTLHVPYSSFFQLGDETEMKKVENDMVRSANRSTLAHTTKRQGEKENYKPSKKPRKETTKGVRASKNRYNYKEVSQSIYMYMYKYTSIYSHSYCSKCVVFTVALYTFLQPGDKFVMELGSPSPTDPPPSEPSQSKSTTPPSTPKSPPPVNSTPSSPPAISTSDADVVPSYDDCILEVGTCKHSVIHAFVHVHLTLIKIRYLFVL